MARTQQNAFNAGEMCENALSRADIAQASRIVRLGLNGTFMVEGGWRRRRGTWFVALPKTGAGDFELAPFTRASGQSVMLELGYASGAGYVRVYGLDRARVGTVEQATPFAQSELNGGLSPLQTGDALVLYRRNFAKPYVIKRLDVTSWAVAAFAARLGPLRPAVDGDGATLTVGASSLGASPGIFAAGDVGGLIRIKHDGGYSPADGWRSDWDRPQANEICYYGGNYYQAEASPAYHTGFLPPVHESGTRRDGNATGAGNSWGVNWTFLHDGATWGTITSFSSASSVGVSWGGGLCTPDGSTTGYYALGAYSDRFGWPSMAPCIHEQRIVTGATSADPDKLDLTRTNGWDLAGADYKAGMGSGLVVADDAIRWSIGYNGARLQWAAALDGLFVATTDALFTVGGAGLDVPLKPTDGPSIKARPGAGASEVLPARTPKTLLYVPRSRRAVIEIAGTDGDYSGLEISHLFQHITDRGVAQVLYMASPWHMFVLRLDDGGVAFVNYNKDQNVLAAAQQDFGGRVFSLAVVAGSDGEDQLWLGIERDNVRMIEVMSGFYEGMFLDSAQFYAGAPATVISGLDRLEGQTVQAYADEQWHHDLVVEDGDITLQDEIEAEYVVAGLGFPYRCEVLPLGQMTEAWANIKAKPVRAKMTARFTRVQVATADGELNRPDADSRADTLQNSNVNGRLVEKRATVALPLMSWTDYDKRLVIKGGNDPFDFILQALEVETA